MTTQSPEAKPAAVTPTDAFNALTIGLDREIFAIEATSVREIFDLVPICEVPNSPGFVRGLINVRGRVVPLADLRVVFGMNRKEPDADTRIVVLEVDIDAEPTIVAIVADRVNDVTDLETAAMEAPPAVGMRWRPEYVRSIARRGEGFIIIPDLGRIFGTEGGEEDALQSEGRTEI